MKKNILLLTILILTGCQYSDNPIDPYEDYNRQVFDFNEQAYLYVLSPTISVYHAVIPSPFRMGINNFYGNMSEFSYALNFGLQGKWQDCYHSGLRLTVNSLFGVGGLFDMAKDLGIPKKRNDFGKTLYTWGYTESAYFICPFTAPSTIRDRIGMVADKVVFNPIAHLELPDLLKTEFFYLDYMESACNNSEHIRNLMDAHFVEDKYAFIRDAYFQHRNYQLENGDMDWNSFYEDVAEDATQDLINESSEDSVQTAEEMPAVS